MSGDTEFVVSGLGKKSVHTDLHAALENFLAQKNNAIDIAKNAMSNFSSATPPSQLPPKSDEIFLG